MTRLCQNDSAGASGLSAAAVDPFAVRLEAQAKANLIYQPFFSAAAEAMRRILIERARKNPPANTAAVFNASISIRWIIALDTGDDLLLLLNEALEEFREKDPTAPFLRAKNNLKINFRF